MMERQQACNELAKFTSRWILLCRPICQRTRKTYYVQRSGRNRIFSFFRSCDVADILVPDIGLRSQMTQTTKKSTKLRVDGTQPQRRTPFCQTVAESRPIPKFGRKKAND
jgi:hypothetical protein